MATARVSIGVPVYNAQRYLRFTLESLLAQTLGDFEVVICDNCSTDATRAVCEEYAARDARVRYERNKTNLGPALNYARCLELARGELFKWNPGDDVCAPTFLARCVDVLDRDPAVVVAYPRTVLIDSNGFEVGTYDYELDLDDPRPHVRLARLVNVNHKRHGAHELYGLIRTSVLRRTGGMRAHVRGDSVLLARLALAGRLRRIDEHLFFNRDHAARSSKYLARRAVRPGSRLSRYIGSGPLPSAEWWDASLKGRIVFPEWRVWREYARAVADCMNLTDAERLACYRALVPYTARHLPKMGRDVLISSEQLVTRLLGMVEETGVPAPRPASDIAPVVAERATLALGSERSVTHAR